MKKMIYLMGIVGLLAALPSCKKDDVKPVSKTEAVKHDAGDIAVRLVSKGCAHLEVTGDNAASLGKSSAAFSQINVAIKTVKVYSSIQGWVDLNVNAGVYDIVSLQNAIGAQIAANTQLKLADITKVAVSFGDENSIIIDGKSMCLKLAEKDITLDLKGSVLADMVGEITLMIDFCDAVTLDATYDSDCYILKPHITVQSFNSLAL